MANTNKNANTTATETDAPLGGKNRTNREKSKSQKSRNRRRGASTGSDRAFQRDGGHALDRFTKSTPVKQGATLLFPSDSAAAQAFGTFTTTPGQDNFIAEWSKFTPVSGMNLDLVVQSAAKRTSNAMRIDFVPYFGALTSSSRTQYISPVRMAALNLKQYIDTTFGTVTSYDPASLIIYLMAVAAVWPLFAEIRRDLRLTITALQRQFPQYVPMGLFALLEIADDNGRYENGEGYEYTARNLRSFVDQYNRLAVMMNQFPMPPELTIFGYNDDLFDAIFLDSEDVATAQMYVFRNAKRWVYDEERSTLGATLKLDYWNAEGYRSIQEKLNGLARTIEQITALRSSSSAMLTNMYNAYGSKDLAKIAPIDYDSLRPLDFVYDPQILTTIENLWWSNAVQISDIQELSATSEISASVYVPVDEYAALPNLPLQFHKDFATVTPADKGAALRMHPAFLRCATNIPVYTAEHPEGTTARGVLANNYIGFAIPTRIAVGRFSDSGSLSVDVWNSRLAGASTGGYYESVFNDFSASPIFVYTTWEIVDGATRCILHWYSAARDVEHTYRLGDLEMFWVYLTQEVWAGNVDRNTTGTRK